MPEVFLNSKQKLTLDRISEVPVLANIKWADVESLFLTLTDQLGGEVRYGSGSIVILRLPNAKPGVFHKPHKAECDQGTIRSIRRHFKLVGFYNDSYIIS